MCRSRWADAGRDRRFHGRAKAIGRPFHQCHEDGDWGEAGNDDGAQRNKFGDSSPSARQWDTQYMEVESAASACSIAVVKRMMTKVLLYRAPGT